MEKIDSNQIIDDLGGTVAVSLMFGVTKGAVSQWRERGIPEPRLMYLRIAHPDVFKTDRKAA